VQCILRAHVPYPFQARIKQLAATKTVPAEDYIRVLPATPQELLAQHPLVAGLLFDEDSLPVLSPIPPESREFMRSRIKIRPGRGSGQLVPAQAVNQLLTPQMCFAGLCKLARMHACVFPQTLQ